MKKKFMLTIFGGLLLCVNLFGLMHSRVQAASIDPKGQACDAIGAASASGSSDCSTSTGPDISSTLKLGINAFSLLVGFAAIVMIIVGGFKYITSQGESANTAGAKNTILYAIVGLVVVALAQVIVVFVLKKATVPCPKNGQTVQRDGTCR